MTSIPRMHAAEQLLRLGAMTAAEFHRITGWPRKAAESVLRRGEDAGRFRKVGEGRGARWEVAHG